MLRRVKHIWPVMVIAVLVLAMLPGAVSYADGACAANITPSSVNVTSNTTFTLTVTNNGSTDVAWVDVTVPANLRYGGNYVYDWAASERANGTTFTNNTLAAGQTTTFSLAATAGLRSGSDNVWQIQMSDDPGGAGAVTCSGNVTTSITGHPPAGSNNGVSNIAATNITSSSVTLTWDTDSPTTAIVYYGKTASYGSTSGYNTNSDTSHSATINGLSAATTYHFQVAGDDGGGGFAYSGDNTFVTGAAPVVPGGGTGSSGGGSTTGGTVTTPTGAPTELVPPTVVMTTQLAKSYKASPLITGTASDNDAVAKVEYSIDGGKNWVRVDAVTPATVTTGKGRNRKTTTSSANVTFQFVPIILEDGNYPVTVRATDPSGNASVAPAITVVLDRLPPRIGSEVITFGNQAALPDAAGRWQAVVDLDQTITVNAVGGPVSIVLKGTKEGSDKTSQSFILSRDAGSGLWAGAVSFRTSGTYGIVAEALDGAGNETQTPLASIAVLPPAKVTARSGGSAVQNAKITLYHKQANAGGWVQWDGSAYGQTNPQSTKSDGSFRMLIPAGTYHLKIESGQYKTIVTRQFTLNRPTPFAVGLKLDTRPHVNLGFMKLYLPWISLQQIDLNLSGPKVTVANPLVGRTFPGYSLPNTSGSMSTAVGLLGRPTVVSVVSTWGPSTGEQLPALVKLSADKDLNVSPLIIGERLGKVQSFMARTGYDLPVVVDSDAILSTPLGVPNLPTHYILDRRGKVKTVLTGVKTKDQLLEAMTRN